MSFPASNAPSPSSSPSESLRRAFRYPLFSILFLASCARTRPPLPPNHPIDTLDFFLQTDDSQNTWTLGGTDVRPAIDPDGTNTQTILLNKFSSATHYEVYKVTPSEIQLR